MIISKNNICHFIIFAVLSTVLSVASVLFSYHIANNNICTTVFGGAVVLFVSAAVMHRQIGIFNINKLTITGFFYLSYVFIIFIPSFFVYRENPGLPGDRFYLSVVSVLVFYPVGISIASYLLRFRIPEIETYYSRPIITAWPFSKIEKATWVFLAIGITIMCAYLLEVLPVIGGIPPIIKLFSGSESYFSIIQLREDSLKLLDSPFKYFYILLRDFYFPLITVLCFTIYLAYRCRGSRRLFLFTLLVALIYGSFTLAKSPVAIILFLLLLCYYVFKKGNVRKKFYLIVPALVLLFPIIIVMTIFNIAGNEKGVFDAIIGMSNRIFISPSAGIFNFFDIFPFESDFVYGRTIEKLNFLFGRKPLDLNSILVAHEFVKGPKLESLNMSGGFIGYFNADFGLPGVMILTMLTGLLLQLMQIHFLRKRKTIPRFAAYVFVMYSTIFFNLTSVPNTMLQRGMLIAFIFPFVFSLAVDFLGKVKTGRIAHQVPIRQIQQ